MNRRGVLALVAAGVTVLAGAAVVVVTLNDDQPARIKAELLDGLRPNPRCPAGTRGPALAPGRTRVNIARVTGGCLVYSSEVVADGKVDDRLADLRAEDDVAAADRAVVYRPTAITAPSGQEPQWPLEERHLNGGAVRALWPAGAAEVRVAVIDTGIDERNPDLRGQVVERAPWAKVYAHGENKHHGFHVAGIIAANDDGEGVVGLTPRARLMDVQYWNEDSEKNGDVLAGPTNDVGGYVTWSVNHGADVINMSFSGDYSDTMAVALLYAERSGVPAIGSAGNCGVQNDDCPRANPITWPAAAETVLSVANHNRDDHRSETSSANSTVDVAAPGEEIPSDCQPAGAFNRRTICPKTGTSMAAPYVAATVALLRARQPSASPAAIREAIVRTARPAAGQQRGQRNDEFGYGLLEPVDAVQYLDEHPGEHPGDGPTTPRTDPVVAAYVSGPIQPRPPGSVKPPPTGVVRLATAGGRSIPVQGVKVAENGPRLAFSPGGPYFAAVDGAHLTLVNLDTGEQRTVDCVCNGIAFDIAGDAVSADRDSLHRYDPATGRETHKTPIKTGRGGSANPDQRTEVVATARDLVLVRISGDRAGSQAFLYGVNDDGDVTRFGGPRSPRAAVAVSDDGTKVAYGPIPNGCEEYGGPACQQPGTALAVAALEQRTGPDGGPKLSRFYAPGGPLGGGLLSDLHFDGDQLVAGWSAKRGEEKLGPPGLFRTAVPTDPNSGARPPSEIGWTSQVQGRAYTREPSTGEQLYGTDIRLEDPSQGWRMRLWFLPEAGRGKPVKLADDVLEVIPRLR